MRISDWSSDVCSSDLQDWEERVENDRQNDVQQGNPFHRARRDRRIGIAGLNVCASLRERIDRTLRGSASKAVARLRQRIDEHRLPNELTAARAHSCGVHITAVVVQAGRRLRNRNSSEETT